MEEYEVYDKYFIEEEYNLEEAPNELYSYRAGWNDALKRAARVVRHDIRSKGKWEFVQYDGNPNIGNWHCSLCRHIIFQKFKSTANYCPNCGALMTNGEEYND